MSKQIKIAIAESSDVIRAGIISILKRMNFQILFFEIKNLQQLRLSVAHHNFDILILNPILTGFSSPQQLKKEFCKSGGIKIIALQSVLCENSLMSQYDESVSIFDSNEQIISKLKKTISSESDISSECLSSREKEIVGLVVQGLSNKQIAQKLNLSIHTVITHRRNISTKLDIHSTSGLTIYAIVNKLIEIDDINKND
jgi:DNA-binding CsgD family transcriptional regulator